MKHRSGNTIVEVLLAIGIAGIVVASVGNLIVSINRVDRTSAHRDQAVGYARQALEIASASASGWFSCRPSVETCSCAPLPGYTSCWLQCPKVGGITCDGVYGLTSSTLENEPTDPDNTGPMIARELRITDIDTHGTNGNIEKITAIVSWEEHSQPKSVTQEAILTGWKNVP